FMETSVPLRRVIGGIAGCRGIAGAMRVDQEALQGVSEKLGIPAHVCGRKTGTAREHESRLSGPDDLIAGLPACAQLDSRQLSPRSGAGPALPASCPAGPRRLCTGR